jgi:copper(I)-binding protein
MLHENSTANGVTQMRMLDGVDIPAKGEVMLAPGGKHIMLEGLRGELVKGYRFEVQLTFDKSGRKVVPVTVVGANER